MTTTRWHGQNWKPGKVSVIEMLHEIALLSIASYLEDEMKECDDALKRFHTETLGTIKRAHIEFYLRHRAEVERLMELLVNGKEPS